MLMDKKEVRKIVITTLFSTVVAIVVLGGGGYLLYAKAVAPWVRDFQIKQQANTILRAVGKVVLLPPDEEPQVSTIINAEELRAGDSFFELAKDGDAAIFYPASGMIILFDLKTNKLLNMGTIATSSNLGDTNP